MTDNKTDRSVTHSSFSLERTYDLPPERVFAAWSSPDAKRRWFATNSAHYQLDFRVGGQEVVRAERDGRTSYTFTATYRDIVPAERMVWDATMHAGERLTTVSLTTVQFEATGHAGKAGQSRQSRQGGQGGQGTRLTLTEQGTFLDNLEQPEWRERGTSDWLDALDAELQKGSTS